MARSKRAAALFEVMAGDKKGIPSRMQSSGRSPSWWFKSPHESAVAEAVDPNDPTTTPIKSSLIAPRMTAVEEPQPQAQPAARPVASVNRLKRDPADPTKLAAPARPNAESSRPVQFDRMRREVKLRLSLTHAVVAGFAVMMIVALAYVVGKHDSAPSAELVTTETTPAEPVDAVPAPIATPKPKVLDVSKPTKKPAGVGSNLPIPSRLAAPGPVRDHDFVSTPPVANSVQGMHVAPRLAAIDAPRTIGLNYVIAQSYPNEQTAKDARDCLIKNGIPCTIEKGTGFAPNWYSVVSSRGFEHIHTNECENFKTQIEKIGDKFAENGKFNRFDPMLYSWKDSH